MSILAGIIVLSGFLLLDNRSLVQAQSMMGTSQSDPDNSAAIVETDSHTESIEAVLQEILAAQKVSLIQELDYKGISDDEWERLGDAVMEQQHPGEAHGLMDQMMGREGSDSLRQIHINMGKSYLGYGTWYGYGGMMGYRNNLVVNDNSDLGQYPMMGFGSMMGYGKGIGGAYGIFSGLSWLALITFLLAGTYFFITQSHKKRNDDS